jgi:hypothetical protein
VRKVISIVLVTILLLNLIGGPAYFCAQLIYQRQAMRQLLAKTPKDQLTRLDLTINGLEDARVEDDELLLNGKMFDIAQIEIDGNTATVYGLFDMKENGLLASLRAQSRKNTENSASDQVIARFVTMTFIAEYFQLPTAQELDIVQYFDSRSVIYQPISLNHLNPPPERSLFIS